MSNKCGQCLLFQGPNQSCGANRRMSASTSAPTNCFKGPASLFSGKKCGGCRLYQGPNQSCGANRRMSSSTSAPSNCFAPNPG